MRIAFQSFLGAALGVALTTLPGAAQARDPVAAEALFNEGRALSEKGDNAGACAKFEESLRLDAAAGTLLNLASCEELIGELADAWMHWQQAAAALPDGDERISIAKERLSALEKRLPRLQITLSPDAPKDSRIERDGTELRSASFDVPLPVNPGRHVVVVRAPGRADREYEVTAAEGKQVRLVVSAGAAAAPLPPAPIRLELRTSPPAARFQAGSSEASVSWGSAWPSRPA